MANRIVSRLRPAQSSLRNMLIVFFWLWGAWGFFNVLLQFALLGDKVGVGSSAYLSVVTLIWIAGMLLFGIGSLLVPVTFEHVVKEPDT